MKNKIDMDLATGKTSDDALREMGYYKLYGLGSLKYEYNKKGSPN